VVEGGVARLDDEAVACLRRDRLDELSAETFFGRLSDEPCRVPVPDPTVVVGVEDRKLASAGLLQSGQKAGVPCAKGRE
jgi:hypothetical protein